MSAAEIVNVTDLPDGIYDELTMSEYLAHPAIGSSSLKKILQSPADFKASLTIHDKDTKATTLGTAIHSAVLEPESFADLYALQPEDWGPRNKGDGYKKWSELKKANADKIVIGWEEASLLHRVLDACQKHRSLQLIQAAGRAEVTAICTHKGQKLKARGDWLTDDGYLWDVKTTSKEIDDSNLAKTVFFNGYHFQAAHHTLVFREAGIDVKGFGWIFISTATPAVHVITRKASIDVMEAGAYDHCFAIDQLRKCNLTGQWNGFDDEIKELKFPEFLERNYDELYASTTFTSSRSRYLAV